MPCEAVQKLHDFDFAGIVEEGGGLVEKDDGCLLCECFCNHHLLPFAVAECLYHAVLQVFYSHIVDGFCDDIFVCRRQFPPESGIGASPESYEFADGHVLQGWSLSEHNAYEPRQFFVGISSQRLTLYQHVAGEWRLESGECAQEG